MNITGYRNVLIESPRKIQRTAAKHTKLGSGTTTGINKVVRQTPETWQRNSRLRANFKAYSRQDSKLHR